MFYILVPLCGLKVQKEIILIDSLNMIDRQSIDLKIIYLPLKIENSTFSRINCEPLLLKNRMILRCNLSKVFTLAYTEISIEIYEILIFLFLTILILIIITILAIIIIHKKRKDKKMIEYLQLEQRIN